MRIDPTTFHAKYVCSPKIKIKSNKTSKYFSYPVSFVELEPFNERDVDTIAKVSGLWGPLTLAYEICNDMKQTAKNLKSINEKFYALSVQKNNFDKLDEKELIGIVAVKTQGEKCDQISYLQAHPKYIYKKDNNDRDIKNIGKTMLRTLKKLTAKSLEAECIESKKPFYENCGFEETASPNVMRWEKPNY